MKVINTLRTALAKIILKRRMSRENNTSGFPASEAGGDWKSSYADTTYYQPTLRTQTAVRSTKADRKPGLYYVRKRGSTRVWLEKVDEHGNHKQLSRPSAGKSRPRKNKHRGVSSRSESGSGSEHSGTARQDDAVRHESGSPNL
ncbi:hypothetical protein KJ359_005271 [Pestalotiopsis sp. 9143b]|nr:hypothetical protein KJ359_005271 [Pestalotiopsis sp. 9143b]